MWSKIFNNPSLHDHVDIRELLLKDFDFESVYFNVLHGSRFSEPAKEALRQAVENAYKDLDDTVKNWVFNHDNPSALNTYGLSELISFMSGHGSEQGWFFTLNQDLFLERKNGFRSPGAAFPQPFIDGEGRNVSLVTLPTEEAVERIKGTLNNTSYIKLHGSYGWVSSHGGNQMVIGKNKANDINQEPLLKWYSELFQKQIYEGNKKLLIIGYGFGDDHINDVLLKGVQEHGLSLYVISPSDPENLRNKLEGKPAHFGSYEVSKYFKIWDGIRGYFPYSLRQIFPPDQSQTTVFREILKSLS